MAVTFTFTEDRRNVFGDRFARTGVLTATGTATAAGDAVTADTFDLNEIDEIMLLDGCNSAGYVQRYDKPNGKILHLFGDNNNAADGPLIAATGATVTGTTRVCVLGY